MKNQNSVYYAIRIKIKKFKKTLAIYKTMWYNHLTVKRQNTRKRVTQSYESKAFMLWLSGCTYMEFLNSVIGAAFLFSLKRTDVYEKVIFLISCRCNAFGHFRRNRIGRGIQLGGLGLLSRSRQQLVKNRWRKVLFT